MPASLYRLYEFEKLESVKIQDSGISFRLRGISRIILIRTHWDLITAMSQARDYKIICNYAIKTPVQPRPYIPQKIWAIDENHAIIEYIENMLDFYKQACDEYHYHPRNSWLRPLNNYFSGDC